MIEQVTIHSLIHEVYAEMPDADPQVIANAVFDRISADDLREYCVAAFIPIIESKRRLDLNRALKDVCDSPINHPRGMEMPGGTRSTKVKKRRDAWEKFCDKLVKLDGTWKKVGKLTMDECDAAAAIRDQQSAAIALQAERFRRIAKMGRMHNAAVVEDIPSDLTDGLLKDVA